MSKPKCSQCGKSTGKLKYYIIADDLEQLRPMHEKCFKKFQEEYLIEYCKQEEKNDKNR